MSPLRVSWQRRDRVVILLVAAPRDVPGLVVPSGQSTPAMGMHSAPAPAHIAPMP
jgi:hypothetical protein